MATTTIAKKRVRFEEDKGTRQVKRRISEIYFPKSSQLTREEKTWYWMQPEDHRHTLQDVLALMHECRQQTPEEPLPSDSKQEEEEDPHKVSFAQYAEALALTFTLCDTSPLVSDQEEDEDEPPVWNIRDSRSVAQLALWASHHTPTRGVESRVLPGLHAERQLRRTRTIQGVLEAQTRLQQANVDEKMNSLGNLSRSLSHSAKQFATALAVVDGTQAYLEYTSNDTTNEPRATPQEECTHSVTPTKELEPSVRAKNSISATTRSSLLGTIVSA